MKGLKLIDLLLVSASSIFIQVENMFTQPVIINR